MCDDGYGMDQQETDEAIERYRKDHNATYNKYYSEDDNDEWVKKYRDRKRREYNERHLLEDNHDNHEELLRRRELQLGGGMGGGAPGMSQAPTGPPGMATIPPQMQNMALHQDELDPVA